MDALHRAIRSNSSTRLIKKGAILLYQSEIPRHGFIIKRGLVRAYTITSSGEERIVTVHSDGDILPLAWVMEQSSNTLFYYDALSDCEVITVSRSELVKAIESSSDIMKHVLSLTVNEYSSLLLRITALEQSSAAEKIALTLYYLILRHGKKTSGSKYEIRIKMTQSMLASLVGITRESTAINLKLLKKKGIVTYKNFIYVVDKSNLERFVGEDSFKNASMS